MPFKSQAQRRKFAELLVRGQISNETFEEWNRETGRKRLPERVTRKKSKKKARVRKKPKARVRKQSKPRVRARSKTGAKRSKPRAKRPQARARKRAT